MPNCRACAHSYMEPDSGLICGHPDAGEMGTTIRNEPLSHCPAWSKFKQHPLRNADGSLKLVAEPYRSPAGFGLGSTMCQGFGKVRR